MLAEIVRWVVVEYVPKGEEMVCLSLSGPEPGSDLSWWVVCALVTGDHV